MERPVRSPRRRRAAQPAPPDELAFRIMAESMMQPCWIADPEGLMTWVNRAWADYTGLPVEKIGPDTLASLHDPQILSEVRRRWAAAREIGEPADMVFPLRARDGTFRLFHTHIAPLRDRQGRVSSWIGINTDISEDARTDAQLRTREHELREVFDRAGDSIMVTSADADFIDVNPAACELLGYSREEFLKLNIYDILDPEMASAAKAVKAKVRNRAVSRPWRLLRKDGSWANVEITSRRLSDGRNLGVARDISEHLRREDDLRARADAAERNLKRFWHASRDLLAISSLEDAVPTVINEHAWQEVLGYPPEKILGQRIIRLVHPDDHPRSREVRARVGAGEAIFGHEDRYRRADGQWVWLSWNIVPEGELVFSIARDVTEEKRRAEHAERAQRLESLGKLTGGVAHDFNNLLMTVLGALDLMQRRPDDHALRDRLMAAALAAVRRGERLNKQLLSFARAEPGGSDVTDVSALLEDMRPLLQSALGEVDVRYELTDEPRGCAIEAANLEAAVLNLVVNARDAMPGGGTVNIRTRRASSKERLRYGLAQPHDYLVLEVADTGEGMSREVLAHVFEPFFTTKAVGQGSGLGLSQVYGAARQAGGLATADSAPGSGTTIRMFMRAADVEEDTAAPAVSRPSDESDRVLLVEDDALVAVVTQCMLEDAGYNVTRTGDAMEALTALRGGRFDIMVTDVRMPGTMNGVDLAQEATRRDPKMKVMLCSGWTAESLGPGVTNSPWPLLPKPYDEAQLRRALDELKRANPPAT